MLIHWNKLFNTDCQVLDTGSHIVYPIFRVGWTTLITIAEKKIINNDIENCKHIDILIRDPKERFQSGVNEYCFQNNLDLDETYLLIEQGKFIDRHFVPQYFWLLHLYKYYKGNVTLRKFEYIDQITNVHKHRAVKNEPVVPLKSFVDVDYKLMDHYNETIELGELIKRYRNVLS